MVNQYNILMQDSSSCSPNWFYLCQCNLDLSLTPYFYLRFYTTSFSLDASPQH